MGGLIKRIEEILWNIHSSTTPSLTEFATSKVMTVKEQQQSDDDIVASGKHQSIPKQQPIQSQEEETLKNESVSLQNSRNIVSPSPPVVRSRFLAPTASSAARLADTQQRKKFSPTTALLLSHARQTSERRRKRVTTIKTQRENEEELTNSNRDLKVEEEDKKSQRSTTSSQIDEIATKKLMHIARPTRASIHRETSHDDDLISCCSSSVADGRFTSTLRPGLRPGLRKKGNNSIDHIRTTTTTTTPSGTETRHKPSTSMMKIRRRGTQKSDNTTDKHTATTAAKKLDNFIIGSNNKENTNNAPRDK